MEGITLIDDGVFEINGERYSEIEHPTSRRTPKMLMMASMMMAMSGIGGSNYSRPMPQVNLVEEYKLILEKKSKLSRWERDMVVSQFKRKYTKI